MAPRLRAAAATVAELVEAGSRSKRTKGRAQAMRGFVEHCCEGLGG